MNITKTYPGDASILNNAGIDPTPRKGSPCPNCGGRDRFTLFANGRHYCRGCGGGDAIDLIQKVHGCSFKEALTLAGSTLPARFQPSLKKSKASVDDHNKKRIDQARRIVSDSIPIEKNSDVCKYLTETRGFLPEALPHELLQHNRLAYFHQVEPGKVELLGHYPAMIAPVKSSDDSIIAAHITYLLGGQKAPVPSPKKLIGSPKGGVVRLYPAGSEVGIAEGIETAIAAHILFKTPVWAALSASFMPLIEIPDGIRLIHIYADNDANKAGQKAAHRLIEKLRSQEKTVGACKTPTASNTDFYDVYKETFHEDNTTKSKRYTGSN
ncbi:MAG: toprim domain-containing protein [Candidatus Obscuribacter sp.]|nr:toprim domain-containing protein [Candidatus Obscuribacter sp.]MBK9279611.1 toprim domain-containing protein [Candidatus Obscuribacter sp.]